MAASDFIAGYAAIVATASVGITLRGRRHRVKVEASTAVNMANHHGPTFQHVVTVSNGAERPAWITMVSIFDEDGLPIVGGGFGLPPVPFTLTDGQPVRHAWDAARVTPARVVVQVSHGPTIEVPFSRYEWQRYGLLWRRRRVVRKPDAGPLDGLQKV